MIFLTYLFFFFFNDTAATEIYTLSLHDALPISEVVDASIRIVRVVDEHRRTTKVRPRQDRKSTRLNSSHRCISYAVFCLKKKKKKIYSTILLRSKVSCTNIHTVILPFIYRLTLN